MNFALLCRLNWHVRCRVVRSARTILGISCFPHEGEHVPPMYTEVTDLPANTNCAKCNKMHTDYATHACQMFRIQRLAKVVECKFRRFQNG